MKMNQLHWKLGALLLLAGIGSTSAFAVPISVATVGSYAASPTLGMTINDATSNAAANGVTLANFQTMITAAFAANMGGVIDAEDQSAGGTIPGVWRNNNTNYGDGAANQITASYGVAQGNTVGIYRTDLDPVSGLPVAINANTNNAFFASGVSYIGVQGPGSPVNLAFTKGLSALGLTLVPRGADRNVTLTANLASGAILGTTQSINANNSSGAFFWGFSAPAGNPIVGLNITSTDLGGAVQFSRFDDLGFVVAVPEPASMALIGIACLGCLALRCRS